MASRAGHLISPSQVASITIPIYGIHLSIILTQHLFPIPSTTRPTLTSNRTKTQTPDRKRTLILILNRRQTRIIHLLRVILTKTPRILKSRQRTRVRSRRTNIRDRETPESNRVPGCIGRAVTLTDGVKLCLFDNGGASRVAEDVDVYLSCWEWL